MSDVHSDGGPAFPTAEHNDPDDREHLIVDLGMSLRDWFAGKALAGLMSHGGEASANKEGKLADMVYRQADAMIVARRI